MNYLSQDDINEIYRNYIVPLGSYGYITKYQNLPIEKNNKKWNWEHKDFPRIISLLEFEGYINKHNFQIDNLLVFNSDDDPEIEYLNGRVKNIHICNYLDDIINHDLHRLNLENKNYDFVCLHQTLEHVYNPNQCLESIYNHMEEKGYLYINVPACNIPHAEPNHFFTGYTSMGLACIAKQAGFKILELGQWGNVEYLNKLFNRSPQWPDYKHMKNTINEIRNPVITWGLFQK
jgi:SAM-dependent methyltransferase